MTNELGTYAENYLVGIFPDGPALESAAADLMGRGFAEAELHAYCGIEGVPHIELNGHILIPLQNIASLHCSSRCDAPEPDWPPRGLTGADGDEPT